MMIMWGKFSVGMIVGLVIKLAPGTIIQDMVKFKQGFFFNLLLPPIILNSGYELKRVSTVHHQREMDMVGEPGDI